MIVNSTVAQVSESTLVDDKDGSPIHSLGSEYQNSIELLKNRFRVDHNIEELTMIFFREYGSSPIVLVRPDGSKIFQSNEDSEKISWFDAETYDLIRIKNPTPGPWQAVGQIKPGSRIMVLSEIGLHSDPIPAILFSGEILKQTAYLTNGDELIDYGPFRDVVQLTIELVSTNNPEFDNFGALREEIARYQDNGRGFDERPLDGVFTGQFNLNIAPGEWKPIFRVATPMFTREHEDKPIRIYKNPIIINEELHGGGENYHKLIIDVNRELVDITSLIVDGQIRFPNGDVQNFSLTESSELAREHMIVAYEDGVFRIKLTAYGKTINNRDFVLDVPEYSFLVKNAEPETDVTDISAEEPVASEEQTEQGDTLQNEVDEEDAFPLSMIIWINVGILSLGLVGIFVIVIIRNGLPSIRLNPLALFKKKTKNTDED
ncbi:TIGR03503 family protein [Alteromonas sp. 5E99-2]|uniref:TIGR03503 family protein n=1 Tax=Alteromonas sp. 5E99-2 TaxID=2817683 RepID=UPI001A988F71|nr:TIGR03503 family protein [Alteromonas sp. 5E99-2]MBO1254943.1 TIGR03503 family protein [Alteromonas sp. 5E99-2]